MTTPTLDQLKRALVVSERIETLQNELAGILGNHSAPVAKAAAVKGKKRSTMSAKARALISAAQKARWAKLKGKKAPAKAKAPAKKKRTMSPETKAKMAAAMKARWAAAKAGKGPAPTAAKKK